MELILPTADMQLVINLLRTSFTCRSRCARRVQSFRGAVFVGAYSEFVTIDTEQQSRTMGVHFKRGGAFPFLRIPPGPLVRLTGSPVWSPIRTRRDAPSGQGYFMRACWAATAVATASLARENATRKAFPWVAISRPSLAERVTEQPVVFL
jgi:uncharacterized protein DUF6597